MMMAEQEAENQPLQQHEEDMLRHPEIEGLFRSNREMNELLDGNLNLSREMQFCSEGHTDYNVNEQTNTTESASEFVKKLRDEQSTQLTKYIELVSGHVKVTNAELHLVHELGDSLEGNLAREIQGKYKSTQDQRDETQRAPKYFERIENQRNTADQREAGAVRALREALQKSERRCSVLKRLCSLLVSNIAQKEDKELQYLYKETKRLLNFMVNTTEQVVKKLDAKSQENQSLLETVKQFEKTSVSANELSSCLNTIRKLCDTEKAEIIINLKNMLNTKEEEINIINKQKAELDHKHNNFEEEKVRLLLKINESEEANNQLRQNLNIKTKDLKLANDKLNTMKAELNISRAAHADANLRRLNEKRRATNLQQATYTASSVLARRDPPDHVAPTPSKQMRSMPCYQTPPATSDPYHFLSEGDDTTLPPKEKRAEKVRFQPQSQLETKVKRKFFKSRRPKQSI